MNRKIFRVQVCCEVMQTDHYYFRRTKKGLVRVLYKGGRLRFFTLTVPENDLPLFVVAQRWRMLVNTRWWRNISRNRSYVCVYEPHPCGHGWHIHCLTNFYIPWMELDLHARSCLFGCSQIEAASSSCACYVSKYLTKSQVLRRVQDSRHVRIINVSRDLLPLKDVLVSSPSIDYIRSHWNKLDGFNPMERLLFLYYHWVHSFSFVYLWTPDCFERMNAALSS